MSLEVVVLKCRHCGASLSIPLGLEQLACSFCGTAQVVRRSGGVTFLERDVEHIRQGIARVETQVEQIVAAPGEARHRVPSLESQGDRLRLDRERAALHHKFEQGRLGLFGWLAIAVAICVVVGAFERANSRIGSLAFTGAVLVVLLIRESGRIGLRKRIAAVDAEMARLERG